MPHAEWMTFKFLIHCLSNLNNQIWLEAFHSFLLHRCILHKSLFWPQSNELLIFKLNQLQEMNLSTSSKISSCLQIHIFDELNLTNATSLLKHHVSVIYSYPTHINVTVNQNHRFCIRFCIRKLTGLKFLFFVFNFTLEILASHCFHRNFLKFLFRNGIFRLERRSLIFLVFFLFSQRFSVIFLVLFRGLHG